MTDPVHPLPQSGGSFVRGADGRLSPAAPVEQAETETAPAPQKPAVKGPSKAPAKEA